eukprot:COSAG02_NODE_3399_length_6811_cov_16.128278_3_plen_33_part_00
MIVLSSCPNRGMRFWTEKVSFRKVQWNAESVL